MRYVFRHRPLEDNPQADRAAELAEHVFEQTGEFWPVHDALMKRGPVFTPADFGDVARQFNMAPAPETSDSEPGPAGVRIQKDVESAFRSGVMSRTSASTSRIAGDAPNTLPDGSSSAGAGSGLDSAAVLANSRALLMAAARSSSRTGRATRSAMPRRRASEEASGLRRSATQMTGVLARTTRDRRS